MRVWQIEAALNNQQTSSPTGGGVSQAEATEAAFQQMAAQSRTTPAPPT